LDVNRRFFSVTFRHVALILVAMVWSSLAFSDEIHDAAQNGDFEKVDALLKENPAFVFSKDTNGWTPLHTAADRGHKDIVQILLVNMGKIDAKSFNGWTPLQRAALNGHKDVVEFLLANKADLNATNNYGDTPLLMATLSGYKNVVELLLTNKADVNAKDTNGWTPLHLAALKGRKDIAQLLLANNADINAESNIGATPLTLAIYAGYKDTADLLRQHGGQEIGAKRTESAYNQAASALESATRTADALTYSGQNKNLSVTTATIYDAVARDDYEMVNSMLKNNPHLVSSTNDAGQTVLFRAASEGRKDVAKILLEYKADVNFKASDGSTPLHWATMMAHKDVMQLLLDNNADVNAKATNGWTPLHAAKLMPGHKDIAELLQQHGGHE